ncbi:IclR family transcriptional regulator [Actinoallomurus iriomotensis]|uniref:HTH iclR-type domain-containing protein n=1 Tax=Actinoallomurus iriomotensis TaxID=478107 RepID=A0A9W6S161_9ACTN|nr:helix-turn-helix domain-containing protein [Actinoallomurus iriomotensis]GLY85534.1 hypothetical protein Airi02_034630 [Actinoallomurus iriomotensis]
MAGNAREAGRTVASKIFAVVDAFAGPQESLRPADIVLRTGLPMPTALRLVRELVEWGGLERFRDGSYRIGRRMWWLGNAAPCPRRLRESVLPTLCDLATRTQADAYLAVLDGTEVRILERVRSSAGSPDSGSLPPHATAAGKVLLARTPALLRSPAFPLPRLTPYTITTPNSAGSAREASPWRRRNTGTASSPSPRRRPARTTPRSRWPPRRTPHRPASPPSSARSCAAGARTAGRRLRMAGNGTPRSNLLDQSRVARGRRPDPRGDTE